MPASRPEYVSIKEFKEKAQAGNAEGLLLRKQFVLEEVKEIQGEDRTLQFTISTGTVDRDQDTIDPSGWRLDNYLKNPVVLWAHDYGEPPVARSLAVWLEDSKLKSRAQFTPKDMYAFGYMIYQMYKEKFLNATSVGFMPIKWMRNEERGGWFPTDFIEQELLEYSMVPVPSNPEALVEARAKGIDTAPMLEWAERVLDGHYGEKGIWVPRKTVEDIYGLLKPGKTISVPNTAGTKGVVPGDVSRETAPEDTEWEKPALSDFTDENWDDLSDAEKRRIAKHYAWAETMPPEKFGDLKLPHHRPSDGKIVWNGVRAAMGALLGARGGVDIPDGDRRDVYNHLASHYRQFDKEPPEFREYSEQELKELFADEDIGKDDKTVNKSGAVLSSKNKEALTKARDLIQQVLDSAESDNDGGEEDKSFLEQFEKLVERLEAAAEKLAALGVDKIPANSDKNDEPVLELLDEEEVKEEGEIEVDMLKNTVREIMQEELKSFKMAITGRVD